MLVSKYNAVLLYSRTVSTVQSYSTTTYLVYREERRRGGGQEAVRSRTYVQTAQEMSQSSHTNRRVIRTVQSYVENSGNGPGTTSSSKYGYVQDKKVIQEVEKIHQLDFRQSTFSLVETLF